MLLLALCGQILVDAWPHLSVATAGSLPERLSAIGNIVTRLISACAITLLAWGIADYFLQRWRFERSLQMTPEELRREAKEVEGDPHIRNQRRAAARQLAHSRDETQTLAATRRAD